MNVSSNSVTTSTAKVDGEIHTASMLFLALAEQFAQAWHCRRHAQAYEKSSEVSEKKWPRSCETTKTRPRA